MPSVLDLAARLSDAMKATEFRHHPSRIAMQNDTRELMRVRWSLMHSPLRDADTKRALDAATALCRKLRLICSKATEDRLGLNIAAIGGGAALIGFRPEARLQIVDRWVTPPIALL